VRPYFRHLHGWSFLHRIPAMEDTRKIIIIHGFSNDEVVALMRAAKAALPAAKDAIFCTTTPTTMQWKLKDLLDHMVLEDAQMKAMNQKKTC